MSSKLYFCVHSGFYFQLAGFEVRYMTTRFRDLSVEAGWNLLWPFLVVIVCGCFLRGLVPWLPLPWWIARDVVIAIADGITVHCRY